MTHIDVCKSKKFEWRNGELFAVSDSVCGDTAWLDSYQVEQIRAECPPGIADEFPMFVIQRLESGDKLWKVKDGTCVITFAGGDVLCFIEPINNSDVH